MAATAGVENLTGEKLTEGIPVSSEGVRFLKADIEYAVDVLVGMGEQGLTVVRWLGETYYDHQLYRMESDARIREADKLNLPNALLTWYSEQQSNVEKTMKAMLSRYTEKESSGMGMWARNVVGIGPIISAMLLALIDMNISTNPSKIFRYFGLDPSSKWLGREKAEVALRGIMEKNNLRANALDDAAVRVIAVALGRNQDAFLRQAHNKEGRMTRATVVAAIAKRPWNATAKTLAWKIGDSFCKNHNKPTCFYGKLYEQEKARQQERNASGGNAALCQRELQERTFRDRETRELYEAGRIPDGRIELRARRKAVKIFLVHWWAEAYRRKFKAEPPRAWPLEHGHSDEIRDPQLKS